MHAAIGVVGLVLVSAITPGPNNVAVLRASASAGVVASVPAIAGVVAGGLGLLGAVRAGAGVAFEAEPRLRSFVTVGGCLYLAYLGLCLMLTRGGVRGEPPRTSAFALFCLQFFNPKGWVMVLTATSAAADISFPCLAAVFVIVPALCLFAWAALGAAFSRYLARPGRAVVFGRAMGALLFADAVVLAFTA